MAISIEDLLLARLAQENDNKPSNAEALLAGGALGGAAGALAGTVPHSVGRGINKIKDGLAAQQGLTRSAGQNLRGAVKPGFRMAGGLVGAILGGGLGMGTRQLMIENSPAAELLAKAQVQGELSQYDMAQLEQIIGDQYKQMGLR